MKTFSLILAFSILMIEGRKTFGEVQHPKSLKVSNIFPANDRVKKKQRRLKGLKKFQSRIQIFIPLSNHLFIADGADIEDLGDKSDSNSEGKV